MRIDVLILWRRHRDYFAGFYDRRKDLQHADWETHQAALLEDSVSWPGHLAKVMNERGLRTRFIVVNDRGGQLKWASESGVGVQPSEDWEKTIAMAQVRAFRPRVLWIGSLFDFYGDFVREARTVCDRAVTWMGSPFLEAADADGLSVLMTENPETLRAQHSCFDHVIVTKPGFPGEVLDRLGPVTERHNVSFVGGLSRRHMRRLAYLNTLKRARVPLEIFGYINDLDSNPVKRLKQGFRRAIVHRAPWYVRQAVRDFRTQQGYLRDVHALGRYHHGPVFGIDMVRVLAESLVSLNIHIDVAGSNAGNMRLVEATGAGTCLVTDASDNIADLFEPGREVLTFKDEQELTEVVRSLLDDPDRARAVAVAGQKRTLREHTVERMFEDMRPAFEF